VSAVTFQQLAMVVSFSLVCSLFVALTIIPVLASRYLRSQTKAEGSPSRIARIGEAAGVWQDRLAEKYGGLLRWAMHHRKTTIVASVVALGFALVMAPLVGVELSPEADEGEIRVDVQLEPGVRVHTTDAVMQRLASIVRRNVPEADSIMVESGTGGGWGAGGEHLGELRIQLKPKSERKRSAREIAALIRPKMNVEPGMVVRARVATGMFGRMMGSSGGDRVAVEIRGHDLQALDEVANKVRDAMLLIPGVPEAQVNRQPGTPEMLLSVDRLKAATMGLNVSDVAEAMETAIGGRRTSMFRERGDEYNIIVRLKEQDRLAASQIGGVPLVTVAGQTVPAEAIIRTARREGPVSIQRQDQERLITVSGTLGDRDLGAVMGDLEERLRTIPKPADISFQFGGEYEEQQEAFRELTMAAILALILVYMVMAAQFESLRDPFIILFSIPLASIGVITMLVLTNTTFNMQGFLGVIMLVGIVVNNAIILIDYMNQLRREHGFTVADAVITGGSRRLRPVLMTTVTTVLGLIPMALGIGEGSELQVPMARVVIGGLLSSTLITLVLVPVIYTVLEERKHGEGATEAQPGYADVPQMQAGD
jgi:HAE1 family hydrophobic/amphiphilic exporter-1